MVKKLRTWSQLSEEEKSIFFKMKEEGYKPRHICVRFHLNRNSVYHIINETPSYLTGKPLEKNLYGKISSFSFCTKTKKTKRLFTVQQLLDKIGPNPKCYLTGASIDLLDTSSYSLDHIIPRSKGGDNSLENCGLCLRHINTMKSDLTVEEFYDSCLKVLEYKVLQE